MGSSKCVIHCPVISPAPLLSPFHIFDVQNHWSVTCFPVYIICLHFPLLQVGDAWRAQKELSLRHRCLLAPPRGSWVGKRGPKGPACLELLSERWLCTRWPRYNIYSFKANAKQQSLQQSGFHSGPATRVFAFCTCWFYCCWFSRVSDYL